MTDIKKLLIVSGYWPTVSNSISGIFVVQQVVALSRAGYQVTVLLPTTIGRGTARPCSVVELGLDVARVQLVMTAVLRLPEKLSSLPGAIWLNVELCGRFLSRKIHRLSIATQFDGCIVHGLRYIGLSLPWWRHWVHGKSVIVMHGVDPFLTRSRNIQSAKPFSKLASDSAHAVVLVGSRLKEHALSLCIPFAKIRIVANGTDLLGEERVSDRQRSLIERRRILSVSNLVPLKGIDDNLRALAHVASTRPDLAWEYRIVGDGSYRHELEKLVQELNISKRVQFLGRLPYSNTMQEMDEADIFSLPSWNEAFGIVYLEAMARCKPVIGCLENGAAEIVSDGEDGLLIPPQSVSHLAMALEQLIADPEMCQRIGRRARNTAALYSWDHNAQRILQLLKLTPE